MKRWIGALVAVIASCIPIFLARASNPGLLADSDTHVLLDAIRARNAPFSWFISDWPLQNHFYRPVSTLAFELDNRLYASNAAGYGLTNTLLCIACILLLFWFLRELTDKPILAASGAVLFAFQHLGTQYALETPLLGIAVLAAVIGAIRHGKKVNLWAPVFLVMYYTTIEVTGMDSMGVGSIGSGTLGWLPGRTATVMTVFALAAMASYARYERLGATKNVEIATPLTPPSTRSTKARLSASKLNWGWAALAMICVAGALGSYEQAVMLPAVLLATAVVFRFRGSRVRWGWQAGFWSLLLVYIVIRKLCLPSGASGYQLQQFRTGPGVRLSLLNYLLPFANSVKGFLTNIELGPIMFLTAAPYMFILAMSANLTAFYQARRRWILALGGYGMSFIAFLPMAWVKQFPHYSYWPMACRSLFTVTLLWVAIDLSVTACSPQVQQAPLRPDPAPGSLPHL